MATYRTCDSRHHEGKLEHAAFYVQSVPATESTTFRTATLDFCEAHFRESLKKMAGQAHWEPGHQYTVGRYRDE